MIEEFLSQHNIPFERFEHPAVFTCEEANLLAPDLPGANTKNLFLRDAKGKRHFLIVASHHSKVDLKWLGEKVNAKGLGFASPERLQKYLGVTPGSVTLLGLVNDTTHAVELYIDKSVWDEDYIQCHPLTNTATMVISRKDAARFFELTGHSFKVIELRSY